MKPLTEWTTDELRGELYDCGSQFDEALAELLRRERERCADECERIGGEYRYDYAQSAYRAATAIRGLK